MFVERLSICLIRYANMSIFDPVHFFDLENYEHKFLFMNIHFVWEALNKIKAYLAKSKLGSIQAKVHPGAYLINPESITIGANSIVEPGAYIKGPCYIGNDCTIRHGAYIRGDVITGNNCVLGHDTEIKNAIFLNNANAAHFAYVGDCIIGNNVNLGAGTKCANLRLDHEEIAIFDGNEFVPTGLKKLGAILGDYTQIGCNSVTNPGTITGKNVKSYPCMNFGGYISSEKTIKPESKILIV